MSANFAATDESVVNKVLNQPTVNKRSIVAIALSQYYSDYTPTRLYCIIVALDAVKKATFYLSCDYILIIEKKIPYPRIQNVSY